MYICIVSIALAPLGLTTDAVHNQVNEAVLRKVIEWCDHHKGDTLQTQDEDSDARKKTTEIDEWDQKFMQVDQEMLFEIILVSPVRVPFLGLLHAVPMSRRTAL